MARYTSNTADPVPTPNLFGMTKICPICWKIEFTRKCSFDSHFKKCYDLHYNPKSEDEDDPNYIEKPSTKRRKIGDNKPPLPTKEYKCDNCERVFKYKGYFDKHIHKCMKDKQNTYPEDTVVIEDTVAIEANGAEFNFNSQSTKYTK